MVVFQKTDLAEEKYGCVGKKGICNLEKHIENLQKFGVPIVVTLNALLQIQKQNTTLSVSSVKKEDVNSLCLKYGQKVAKVELNSLRK